MQCEKAEPMISGFLDNELTQQESQHVRLHLEECGTCRHVYEQLASLKQEVSDMSYPDPREAELERLQALENDLLASSAASIGWAFVAGIGVILLITMIVMYLLDPDIGPGIKLVQVLFSLGWLGLFISVLRQRLIERRTDKYRKVKI